ncbi:MAG TPA: hypothetical protein VGR36_10765 [Candidatus Acidoferrales bacterium]|nr:hypothetical protein [Candidatus Acidoferrales bacterium]
MMRFARLIVTALILCGIVSMPAEAYEQWLTTEAIREAYFLGSRNDENSVQFFGPYQHWFAASGAGLQVQYVQALTPYAQVVFAAQHYMINENAVDAVQRYKNRALPFVVRAMIYVPIAELPSKYDIEKQSSVAVSQAHPIAPRTITYHPVYVSTGGPKGGGTRFAGVEVELEFDVTQVESRDLKVRVSFSDGRHFDTTFDLTRLK